MSTPADYHFTDEHEWATADDDGVVTIGISEHAQDLLGDVVFVEFPSPGDSVEAGAEFGVVESVKTASELYAPVSGEVVEVNDELHDAPELVNESPYEDGWMIRVEMDDPDELDELMDADAYDEFVLEEKD
jgi:glycine cleavage system H protein